MAHRAAARSAVRAVVALQRQKRNRARRRPRPVRWKRHASRRAGIVAAYWADTGSSEATILNFFTPYLSLDGETVNSRVAPSF